LPKILKLKLVATVVELGLVLLALQACGGQVGVGQVGSDVSGGQNASAVSIKDNQVSYSGKLIGLLPASARMIAQKELEAAGFYPKLPDGVLVPEITRLKDGRIWLSGGVGANNTYSRNTWFFDAKTKQLSKGPALAKESIKHATLLLPDGKVLVSGGSTARPVEIGLVQMMDPKTNSIITSGKLIFARYEHSMVELAPGVIAITGGATCNGDQDEVEIFDLNLGKSRMIGHLMEPRKQHDSLKIDTNHVLVLGGRGFEYKAKELEPEVFVIPENK
jgi:hypothetical protein